jgi:hypothetical protein
VKVVKLNSSEFKLAPQRILHLFAVSRYVDAWSRAEWSLEAGGSVELRSDAAADAHVNEGDFIDPSFDQARASLVREPFVFVVQKVSDETTLQAQMPNYNSYKRFAMLQLWDKDCPETRFEFGMLSFFTTDP